jgi:hypothetical protein
MDIAWNRATPVEGRDFSLWVRQIRRPRDTVASVNHYATPPSTSRI